MDDEFEFAPDGWKTRMQALAWSKTNGYVTQEQFEQIQGQLLQELLAPGMRAKTSHPQQEGDTYHGGLSYDRASATALSPSCYCTLTFLLLL